MQPPLGPAYPPPPAPRCAVENLGAQGDTNLCPTHHFAWILPFWGMTSECVGAGPERLDQGQWVTANNVQQLTVCSSNDASCGHCPLCAFAVLGAAWCAQTPP